MPGKFIGWKSTLVYKTFYLFGIPVYRKNRSSCSLEQEIETLRSIHLVAQAMHPKVFEKYKGIHQGQDIVIVATGPSLDDYSPIEGAIHLGINRAILDNRIPLDYHMCIDDPNVDESILANYRVGSCRKLYGLHTNPRVKPISETIVQKCNAERFYIHPVHPEKHDKRFPLNLSYQPFMVYASVASCAFQFALWCHPRRIYLVGCDTANNGYFAKDNNVVAQFLSLNTLLYEWQQLAKFAQMFYPDVEIISINPVGLKGLFTDATMINGKLETAVPDTQ